MGQRIAKPAKCSNPACAETEIRAKGLCGACLEYKNRTGRDRPWQLIDRAIDRQTERESESMVLGLLAGRVRAKAGDGSSQARSVGLQKWQQWAPAAETFRRPERLVGPVPGFRGPGPPSCVWPRGCGQEVSLCEGRTDRLCYFHGKILAGLIVPYVVSANVSGGLGASETYHTSVIDEGAVLSTAMTLEGLGANGTMIRETVRKVRDAAMSYPTAFRHPTEQGRGIHAGLPLNPPAWWTPLSERST